MEYLKKKQPQPLHPDSYLHPRDSCEAGTSLAVPSSHVSVDLSPVRRLEGGQSYLLQQHLMLA